MRSADGSATATGRRNDATTFSSPLWGLAVVTLVVLASHAPDLAGWVSCNPIYRDTQLQIAFSNHAPLGGTCDIDGNAGGTVQALGHLSAELWLHGRIPWWNHFTGIGLPLAAEMQSTSLFLPFVLLLHFKGGLLWMKMSLQLVGGLSAFLLMRAMRLAPLACLLAGVFFALNSTQAWFADAPEQPGAFLPLLILGIERSGPAAGRAFGAGPALVAVGIAMSLYAGFPETAFADGVLALVWTLVATFRLKPSAWPSFAGQVALGGVTGLLLAAPVLVPFLDGLRQSVVGMHAGGTQVVPPPSETMALLFPSAFGTPDGDDLAIWAGPYGYFGTALALLALLGLVDRPADPLRLALAGWIAVMLATAFGVPGISWAVKALPVFHLMVFSRYVALSTSLAAIVLASLAVDDWVRGRRTRAGWAFLAWAALAVAACRLGAARYLRDVHDWPLLREVTASTIAVSVAAAVLIAISVARPRSLRRQVVVAICCGLDALVAFSTPQLGGARVKILDLAPIEFLRSHLGFDRAYAMGGKPGTNYGAFFGFDYLNTAYEPVLRMWDDGVHRLSSHEGAEAFRSDPTWPIASRVGDFFARIAAFRAMGTKYLIETTSEDPFPGHVPDTLTRVFSDPILTIYRLDRQAPYLGFADAAGPAPCSVQAASRDRQRTECDRPAKLVRRELAAPGWHATVNGRKAPIRTVDGLFQQIDLPQGPATVRWRYAPPHAGSFTIAFVLGLALLGWFGCRSRAGSRSSA